MNMSVNVTLNLFTEGAVMNRYMSQEQPKLGEHSPGKNLLEVPLEILVLTIVVVPKDQTLMPVESMENLTCRPQVYVTKMVNYVPVLDDFIPVLNESRSHLVGGGKRSIAILDDVGVTEVSITNYKYVTHKLSSMRQSKSIVGHNNHQKHCA